MKIILNRFTNKKHPSIESSEQIVKVRESLSLNNTEDSADYPFLTIKIVKRDEIEVEVKSDNYRKMEEENAKTTIHLNN